MQVFTTSYNNTHRDLFLNETFKESHSFSSFKNNRLTISHDNFETGYTFDNDDEITQLKVIYPIVTDSFSLNENMYYRAYIKLGNYSTPETTLRIITLKNNEKIDDVKFEFNDYLSHHLYVDGEYFMLHSDSSNIKKYDFYYFAIGGNIIKKLWSEQNEVIFGNLEELSFPFLYFRSGDLYNVVTIPFLYTQRVLASLFFHLSLPEKIFEYEENSRYPLYQKVSLVYVRNEDLNQNSLYENKILEFTDEEIIEIDFDEGRQRLKFLEFKKFNSCFMNKNIDVTKKRVNLSITGIYPHELRKSFSPFYVDFRTFQNADVLENENLKCQLEDFNRRILAYSIEECTNFVSSKLFEKQVYLYVASLLS